MQNLMNNFFRSIVRPKQAQESERSDMYRKRVLAELSQPVKPVDDTFTRLRIIQAASKSRKNSPQKHWHGK